MDVDSSKVQELINSPGESLSVEVKRWINPDQPEGVAKIVRAALALRNHGGGYLIIGFDNETLNPDKNNVPTDVKAAFHIDKIQGMISKYASEPFEVAVAFPKRGGRSYPVIVIPTGVKTPVAAKAELLGNNKKLITMGDVYIRSLKANNTPSTTIAKWNDWPEIVEVCFNNREADIGRFLRRHLSRFTPEILRELASFSEEHAVSTEDQLISLLQENEERYQEVLTARGTTLPDHGVWETALLLVDDIPAHSANQDFLNLLSSTNPRYTGWPVWLDSRGFSDPSSHPYVNNGVWEAFIVSFGGLGWGDNHLDFMRMDPRGRFYLRRALQDDISNSQTAPKPLSVLDFGLPVFRIAEAIAVGISFAKAMGCNQDDTNLAFAFRWTKLSGRQLGSWAQPGRFLSDTLHAYQDTVTAFVNVPLEIHLSALSEFVNQAVIPLFEVFDGFILDKNIVEEMTRRLVERKL